MRTRFCMMGLLAAACSLVSSPSVGWGDQPAASQANQSDRKAKIAERDRLWYEAIKLKNQEKYADAIVQARAVIAIERDIYGTNNGTLISSYDLISECAEASEDWSTAESARDESLRIYAAAFGKQDWRTTNARLAREQVTRLKGLSGDDRRALKDAAQANSQVVYLYGTGRYAAAEQIALRILGVREKILGPEHPDTATSLYNLAQLCRVQGKYAAAEPLYQRSLKIREKALGSDNPDTATSLNNLALLFYFRGNYAAAEPLYHRSLKVWEKIRGPDHPDTARGLSNLALLYQSQGNYAASEPLHQRALKIHEKALGPDHPSTATSLNNLAVVYKSQGDYAAAEPLYQRALKIREKALRPDHPDTAVSLNNLAELYLTLGNDVAAEPLYQRALKITEKTLGPDHPDTARGLNNLAQLYRIRGNDAAAEPLYQRALKIREKSLGPNHPDTATSLNNLAELYRTLGNYAASEPLYQRALKIYDKALGPDHPDTARGLNNLALLYQSQGNYAASEPLHQRALKIWEKALGPEHPDTATSLNNLAELYRTKGNYVAAESLYQRALKIYDKALGPDHPDTARGLNNLAALYRSQGNYAAAEPLYQRSLKIWEKVLGPDHPDTAISLNNLGLLAWYRRQPDAAVPLVARGLGIQLGQLERTAAIQTEQQQMVMTRKAVNHLYGWLTVTSQERDEATNCWRLALAWKGLTTIRQLRLRQTMKTEPAYAEFRRVSQQLSTLTLNPPTPPADSRTLAAWNAAAPKLRREWDEQKVQLEREHERLEKELALKSAVFRKNKERKAVTAEVLQAALRGAAAPTALVDLLEYSYYGRANERSERRLAAFVVRGDRHVHRLELGAVAPIHAQLKVWRETYGLPRNNGDPGLELRKVLWEPLEPFLKGIDTVLISPDGLLAQLPWGALPGAKPDTYLIEERNLAVIPVPQLLPELLEQRSSSGPPPSLLLAGDIEYGGDAGTPTDLLVAHRSALGKLREGQLLPKFLKLPAAQAELASIKDRYELTDAKGTVHALRRHQATEAAFREQAGRHQWLHVITHGFFAPAEMTPLTAPLPSWGRTILGLLIGDEARPEFVGIGAALSIQDGKCLVTGLVAGGASARDGRLQRGDEIVAIETAAGVWTDTVKKPLETIVGLIRGETGTPVRLRVRLHGRSDVLVYEIVRGIVPAQSAAVENILPGLLSGLAFAGANTPAVSGKDDGILTALEVESLDLSKVETVVLSACETGLGEVAGGEGLLGLQRAFQVAGAKTVVASLWKVPDRATSALMQRFYENLWDKKMGKLAALREAQIWMLRDQGNRGLAIGDDAKETKQSLPPFYWAAFVLSGDWR